MADGPTVQQILRTREDEIRACDIAASASKLEALKMGPTAKDVLTGLFTFDLGVDAKSALYAVDLKKETCISTARAKADSAMAVREASLEAENGVLRATVGAVEKRASIVGAAKDETIKACMEAAGVAPAQKPARSR